jgi:HSP90 family molecular chaperone
MTRVSGQTQPFKPKASLIINTNSPLVQALYKAQHTSPHLAKALAVHIWDLTRLSHKEMSHEEMQQFTERSTQVLEQLVCAATEQRGSGSE